jgi:AcrR family transcriptional regulator
MQRFQPSRFASEQQMNEARDLPVKDRLLASGTALFAEKSYDGVSVREICKHAGTSMNMIHHYFGNKEGLLREVVGQLNSNVLVVPMRLLEGPTRSREDFQSRMGLLFETTLEAYIKHRDVLVVAVREQAELPAIQEYMARFVEFIGQAKEQGIVRSELDTEMITGAMLDRILSQVHHAPFIKKTFGIDVLGDRDYQRRWSQANLDLFLHGFLA